MSTFLDIYLVPVVCVDGYKWRVTPRDKEFTALLLILLENSLFLKFMLPLSSTFF